MVISSPSGLGNFLSGMETWFGSYVLLLGCLLGNFLSGMETGRPVLPQP